MFQGPISVAVFAEDHQVSEALWKVAELRACLPGIRHNVTFALVSPLPAKSSPPLSMPSPPPPHPCSMSHDIDTSSTNYASTHNYPVNLLRNVARRGTASEFVLVIDIDMLPNDNLRQVSQYYLILMELLFTITFRSTLKFFKCIINNLIGI